MTKLDLCSDLLCSINQLLDGGFAKKNIRDVRLLINYSFDRFEEREIANSSELSTIEGIAIKTLDMPKSLHDYFQVLNEVQDENEIYLGNLPTQFNNQTVGDVELMVSVFAILDELLVLGITLCSAHIARLKLDSLFDMYEQDNKGEGEQFEETEKLLTELDDYMEIEREKYPDIFSSDEIQEATILTEF